jgi:hypothetical protein
MRAKSFALVLLIPLFTFGQVSLKQGVRMGGNLNVIGISDLQNQLDFQDFEGTSAKFGYHFGVYSKLTIWKVHLQGDVLFTRVESEISGQVAGISRRFDVSQNRLDFPLGLLIDFPFVQVGGGVGAAWNVTAPRSLFDAEYRQFMTYWFLQVSKQVGPLGFYVRFEFPDDAVSNFLASQELNFQVSAQTQLHLFRIGMTLDLK